MTKAKRNKELLALLFLDLDRFKRINDTLGHDIGDKLLQKVAERIVNSIRKSDSVSRVNMEMSDACVSRLGGDEFTILLSGLKKAEDLLQVAKRVNEAVRLPMVLEGHDLVVTASIGISIFPLDGEDIYTLMKNADTAMYHAKEKGRNNYQFYKQSLNESSVDKLRLEADMRKAIENDEFELYYQPQIDIKSGKIIGAEALIRWQHPKMGMVPPMQFIPTAEECGLIIPINELVLQSASRQNKKWQDMGLPPIRVSVNISSHQFNNQNIDETIEKSLQTAGLDAQYLEVEITETIIMQKGDATISTLQKIKNLGVRIAIDDFGTGYSSLSYLPSFPIDTLKIDRSFVMGLLNDTTNEAIIKAIIAMGHSMKLNIIAEGVETEDHLHILDSFNCDEAQGYLLSKPLPAGEFAAFLENNPFAK